MFQVWYLLGWLNYLQGEEYKGNARSYLIKGKEVRVYAKSVCPHTHSKRRQNDKKYVNYLNFQIPLFQRVWRCKEFNCNCRLQQRLNLTTRI